MKIITPGKFEIKYWWIGRRGRCLKCECVFELEMRDYPTDDSILNIYCNLEKIHLFSNLYFSDRASITRPFSKTLELSTSN